MVGRALNCGKRILSSTYGKYLWKGIIDLLVPESNQQAPLLAHEVGDEAAVAFRTSQ